MISHNDIYIKFMIEYDKAGAQTSYPSLTEYEVATFLDKAYNALIAQKVTGNNYRRAGFEADLKSIADLDPLVITKAVSFDDTLAEKSLFATNCKIAKLSDLTPAMLYFLQASITVSPPLATVQGQESSEPFTAYEYAHGGWRADEVAQTKTMRQPVKLVDHTTASKFYSSLSNIPWVKEPVCFIEGDKVIVVYDALNTPATYTITNTVEKDEQGKDVRKQTVTKTPVLKVNITYIKKPNTFVKEIDSSSGMISYFDKAPTYTGDAYNFECNSTVAEELVSLAVSFALENVESQRLNSKLNMRGLEA